MVLSTGISIGARVRDERSIAQISTHVPRTPLDGYQIPPAIPPAHLNGHVLPTKDTARADAMSDADARQWSRGIASGDRAALGRLFTARADWMVQQCRRLTGKDEHFALDVLQDSMLRIARHMPSLATKDDLDRYLHSVIRSCAIDRLRSELRRLRRDAARHASEQPAPPTPEDIAELERIMAGLSVDDRDTLLRRIARGLGFATMAEQDHTTPTITQGRFRRILESIKSEPPPRTLPTSSKKGQQL